MLACSEGEEADFVVRTRSAVQALVSRGQIMFWVYPASATGWMVFCTGGYGSDQQLLMFALSALQERHA